MKKALVLLLLIALAAALAFAAGCGGEDKPTFETPEGKITVEEAEETGGEKVTIEGEEGSATIEVSDEVPSEEELGAPIYPGADFIPGSGVNSKMTTDEGELDAVGAEFTTGDDFQKVVDWYQDELGQPMVSTPQEATWMSEGDAGGMVTVIVEVDGGEVKITIASISGDLDISI